MIESEFTVIIPARYASTRLPGKPLAMIGNKPMIQHVYERALQAGANRVVIATDDQRIVDAVHQFAGEALMTRADHVSGSDRLAEVCDFLQLSSEAIVVNVQGDEPFISPENISQVAQNLAQSGYPMATLSTPITEVDDVFNPNVVKVVNDNNGKALYFSRAPIAWQRGHFEQAQVADLSLLQRHIGIYAYRAGFLAEYVKMTPAPLELAESLEQLRVLANGYPIHIETAKDAPGLGVDTAEDLAAAEHFYRTHRL